VKIRGLGNRGCEMIVEAYHNELMTPHLSYPYIRISALRLDVFASAALNAVAFCSSTYRSTTVSPLVDLHPTNSLPCIQGCLLPPQFAVPCSDHLCLQLVDIPCLYITEQC